MLANANAWSFKDTCKYPDSSSEEADDGQNGLPKPDRPESSADRPSIFGGPRSNPLPVDHIPELNDQLNEDESNDPFPPGFSDDEDVHGDLDRTYPGSKNKSPSKEKKSPKGKKSPRRDEDDADDEISLESPKPKKARKSTFKPFADFDDEEEADDDDLPPKSAKSVGDRMSSLNLTQQENGDMMNLEEASKEARPREFNNLGLDDLVLSYDSDDAPSEHSKGFIPAVEQFNPNPVAAWNLRPINRQVRTTHLDFDETPNYDPTEEARQKALQLKKAKERKRKGKQKGVPKPRERIHKFIVRLPFKIIGNVLNATDGEENWPDGWSILDTEDEAERQEAREIFQSRPKRRKSQVPIPDPAGELDDLTGHPVARGCVDCRVNPLHDEHGEPQKCSMITDSKWPCTGCEFDGRTCFPIIPAIIKGKCQRCHERGEELGEEQFCSFEDQDQWQGQMCDQCYDAECEDCVAGPAPGYKPERIDLDEIQYGPDRAFTDCTNCRHYGKKCSLKKKSDRPPCKGCKRAKIACTFYDTKKLENHKKGKKKAAAQEPQPGESSKAGRDANGNFIPAPASSEFFSAADLQDLEEDDEEEFAREATPEIEMTDAEGRTGVVTKINTCFAHPIQFNFLGDEANGPDCSFCESQNFAFFGHFEKTVHVLKWNDGLGYGELAAGHREENGKTVMCQDCSISRVQIVGCDAHNIQPFNQGQAGGDDFDEAINAIVDAAPMSAEFFRQQQRWCSMCFSLASFKCSTEQPSFMDTDSEVPRTMDGCGLRLCDGCETMLREEFNGSVSNLAIAMEKLPKWREDTDEEEEGRSEHPPRADVEFLAANGLLMNNFNNVALGDNDDMDIGGEGGEY